MALFRRGRKADPEEVSPESVEEVGEPADAARQAEPQALAFDRSGGPWDITEMDLADQDLPRIDLGSLQIPGIPGLTVQVEADPQTQTIMAVTAMKTDGAVQVQAYAAPKSEGLWDEIRAEIKEELAGSSGQFSEAEGAFGPEIRALVPVTGPDGKEIVQPVRFVGVDGPRWLLRAVFLGRAAVAPDPQDELHHLIRQIVVIRGPDAMAPKSALPLRLPPPEPASAPEGETSDEDPDEVASSRQINPFERGPEITEIR